MTGSTGGAPSDAVPAMPHKQLMRVLYGLMAGMFLAALDQTIVATALPAIVDDLGGIDEITWVVTSYMLATTVSMSLWGKASDLWGRRPTYLAAIGIFIVGSMLCGFAQNLTQLIVMRGVQGIGGGGLMSLSFTIMGDVLSPRHRGRYIGWFSGVFAFASVSGPLAGGLFADHLTWRWIFWINLPIGGLAMAIASSSLRDVGRRQAARLDLVGAALLSVGVASLLLASVWGGDAHAWGSATIVGLFVLSAVAFALFLVVEQRVAQPILAPHVLRNRTMVVAIVIGALTGITQTSAIVYLPLFLQTVTSTSATNSGLLAAPLMGAVTVASIVVGRRISHTGRYKFLLMVGTVLMLAAAVGLTTMGTSSGMSVVAVWMVLLGLGFGTSSPVVNLSAQNALPPADLASASAALMTFRALGSTLGVAGVGAVFLSRLRSGVAGLPAAEGLDVEQLASGPDVIAALREPLRTQVQEVMADAITVGFRVCVPLAVLAVIVSRFMPELPLRTESPSDAAVASTHA